MKAIRFRVQNFRNIDDSDWIELERITAFVGRNESGKTSLLKALHKCNSATPEPYDAQREFPRDRYTRDYVANGSNGEGWPVCSVEFEIPEILRVEIAELLEEDEKSPEKVTATRYYDGSLKFEYASTIEEKPLVPESVLNALETFASSARRLAAPDSSQEEYTAEQRTELANWATERKDKLKAIVNLRVGEGANLLTKLRTEVEYWSNPQTADMIEALQQVVEPVLDVAKKGPVIDQIDEKIKHNLPVLIYFENYGILDSAIWLPRFIEDLSRDPNDSRVRTINAMFKYVGLDSKEITALGEDPHREALRMGYPSEAERIATTQRHKDERAIKLNSASIDISGRFSEWWSQRRHKIRYQADGDYFRIWIADDRRPDVEIELEARSKGFQWFFSFYLVFLAESDDGHKDAILLLDEPGLHLHPTAQQELIAFFEKLTEKNQLAYTTHSPFLIDGEHLHRIRPVKEDDTGHSRITAETWPEDRETIFPLQAAAKRQALDLPKGWKASVALHLVSSWAEEGTTLADEILDTAALLFSALDERFEKETS